MPYLQVSQIDPVRKTLAYPTIPDIYRGFSPQCSYHWTAGYAIMRRADIFILDSKKEIERHLVAEPRFGHPAEIRTFTQFKTALFKNQLFVTAADDKNILGEPAHIIVRP